MLKTRLLKLMGASGLLALGGCGDGGDDATPLADVALCDGQQIETIIVEQENRGGTYTTTRDVITGECITPEQQLKRGFEVTINDYGNTIKLDVAAQILHRTEPLITLPNGKRALRWMDSFENVYRDTSLSNNEDARLTGGIELGIEFLITEDGLFRATTLGDDDAAHLAIFGAPHGQLNYNTFSDSRLRESDYSPPGPMSRYNSNIQQANILAHMLSKSYQRLAVDGAMISPQANHAELYDQSPATIKSYFKRVAFVMRSFIYHNRMVDDSSVQTLDRPVISEWNKLWSPFGDENRNPAQTLMSRSYSVNYEDGVSDDSLTYLETTSGSHLQDSRTSIRVTGHYGGSFSIDKSFSVDKGDFDISCSSGQGGCELSTARNASATIWIKGLMPTRVEMEVNNVWAYGITAVITASFSDWDTGDSSHESPLRTNPGPLAGFIEPER